MATAAVSYPEGPLAVPGIEDSAMHLRFSTLLDKSNELCQRCERLLHIPGMTKLRKQCQAEKQFLLRVAEKHTLAKSHLSSTNLSHLQAVLEGAERLPHVVQVLQPFNCMDGNHTVVVDVVCNHGYAWVKVIARKAQALHLIWAGQGQFGEKTVMDQAEIYQTSASLYPICFATPQVVFLFSNCITAPLAEALEQLGVTVLGKRVAVELKTQKQLGFSASMNTRESDSIDTADKLLLEFACMNHNDEPRDNGDCDIPSASHAFREIASKGMSSPRSQSSDLSVEPFGIDQDSVATLFSKVPLITRINLDITSLICLVSNVCHGYCHFRFTQDVLTEQAAKERQAPVLPKLLEFIKDKELYTCETAVADFRSILQTVGGPQEKARAVEFLKKVNIVADRVSVRAQDLQLTHQIKHRAKTIFATGDELRAITVTANSGFVRASMKQGKNFAVYLHESRALSEQKEATATEL